MSFYRTYRPQTIEELDTKAVRDYVLSLLKKDKSTLPHAYVLTGPKGIGKTTTARLIAKIFNCVRPIKSGEPCGTCDQCTAIAKGQHMDVLEIDAASNTGVDNIRELRDSISLTPGSGAYKIYIIDEVHMLSTGAFNALLKTLEEPPAHAIFILATTDQQKVPATIISRCVRLQFQKAEKQDIQRALERIIATEKISIEPDALSLIVNSADGSYRDAVKNLEQSALADEKITQEHVSETLSLSDSSIVHEYLAAVKEKNAPKGLKILNDLQISGTDIKIFISSCLSYLEIEFVHQALNKTNTLELTQIINTLISAYGNLRISPIPLLPLEIATIEICNLPTTPVLPTKNTPPHTPSVLKEKATAPKEAESQKNESEQHIKSEENDLLTIDTFSECWKDFIEAMKEYNHSISGVLRSTRPKSVTKDTVVIEAFYPFHKEKLSVAPVREALALTIKKLFGTKVNVEIVLGKK
ncbi:DNA polymerase III subunit gamma/tau [Candidatus Gottesmanbacteria bacterium]|nr:DNA polymerase III subunit gamma/tau [Candidatus Gottesmanbacteria bacterium]